MIRWVFNIGYIREFLGRTCGPRIAESVPKALKAALEKGTLSRCVGERAVIASIIDGRRPCQARVSRLREDGGL